MMGEYDASAVFTIPCRCCGAARPAEPSLVVRWLKHFVGFDGELASEVLCDGCRGEWSHLVSSELERQKRLTLSQAEYRALLQGFLVRNP